jgi:hypothetical protein
VTSKDLNSKIHDFHICVKMKTTLSSLKTNQILNRWKDYFSTILNLDTDNSLSNHKIQSTIRSNQTDGEVPPPSYNEVCSIINKLKSNKAGGTDNIIPELVKQGGRTPKQRLHKLILMIWEKEQLANQKKEGRKERRNNLPGVQEGG